MRLRLLRVAYSCRVITPCLSIQLAARLMRSFGVYLFLYRRLTPPMSRSRTVWLFRCLISWGDDYYAKIQFLLSFCKFFKTRERKNMRDDKGLSKREHEVWVGLRPTLVACCFFGMSIKKNNRSSKGKATNDCSLLDRDCYLY